MPEDATLRRGYTGPPRIIVPAIQTAMAEGEDLTLRVFILDPAPPRSGTLYFRPFADGTFTTAPMSLLARNTLHIVIPNANIPAHGLEYFLEIQTASGDTLRWPETAPALNQTIIRGPFL